MKKIAVLVAMPMEAAPLLKRMEGTAPEKIAGKKFLIGRIGGVEIVMHICGMGMRKAARGTRALVTNYKPDLLLNYGVSGGLVPEIGLSDTVVAVSSCPASGRNWITADTAPTDAALTELAAQALPGAIRGPAATSIGIIVNKKRKARLVAKTGAVCIDMETCAAAKTARALGVPLLVIRCMSDTVEPTSLLHFFKNGADAAEKAAADVETVIKKLAEEV